MKKAISYIAIVLFACSLLLYNEYGIPQAVQMPLEEDLGEYTVGGFETPKEAVTYLLSQVKQDNLDAALRVCAISDIAEYFNMTLFLQYTKEFQGTAMIPPTESESQGYIEIARMRLASKYAELIGLTKNELGDLAQFQVIQIQVDEPENPDGMYYQNKDTISEILGARDVAEVSVLVKTDQQLKQLKFSLARYKKYWKIILFNDKANWKSDQPFVQEVAEQEAAGESLDLEKMSAVVLPKNYYLLGTKKAETIKDLAAEVFFYLQKGDVLSAMSYLQPADIQQISLTDALKRQGDTASKIQQLYYAMFLYDPQKLEWVDRHYEDMPESITELLDMENMIYAGYSSTNILAQGENTAQIQGIYNYAKNWYGLTLNLVNDNGWMISSAE